MSLEMNTLKAKFHMLLVQTFRTKLFKNQIGKCLPQNPFAGYRILRGEPQFFFDQQFAHP